MNLLTCYVTLCAAWGVVFPQERSWLRAVRHALSGLCALGRRTISRAIMAAQRQDRDWSGEYLLYSRSGWDAARLFDPLVAYSATHAYPHHIAVAFDDTKLKKTGRKIPGACWQHDPLSPPFHINLLYGVRFLQASALLPLHQQEGLPARGLPVRFEEAPVLARPGRRASAAELAAHRKARRTHNLSTQCLATMEGLRVAYDRAGAADKNLVAVCDGSFCNRTVLRGLPARVTLLTRCRQDARLCRPAAPGTARHYDRATFTPHDLYQAQDLPWHQARIFHGGQWRDIRFKCLDDVRWRTGAGRRPVRVIVIAPTPYRTSRNARLLYRRPAYLLTTDLTSPAELLIQMYMDRWEIEVNHREEKDTLGIGQAQVWSARAVPRQPALMVAAYSLLLLAGLLTYGGQRTNAFLPLPRWRRNARRPSCLDLVTQLRREMAAHPEQLIPYGMWMDCPALVTTAAA